MECTRECSGCFNVQNCDWFFNNFILPDIKTEEEKIEYLKEQANYV